MKRSFVNWVSIIGLGVLVWYTTAVVLGVLLMMAVAPADVWKAVGVLFRSPAVFVIMIGGTIATLAAEGLLRAFGNDRRAVAAVCVALSLGMCLLLGAGQSLTNGGIYARSFILGTALPGSVLCTVFVMAYRAAKAAVDRTWSNTQRAA